MKILQVINISDEIVEAFELLIPQLANVIPPNKGQLEKIISSDNCCLYIARDGNVDKIVGTLTLIVMNTPTGVQAWIEDVVVDENARGKGVGKALILTSLKRAEEMGAKSVCLTSRPSRVDANRLYRSLGFIQPETNYYRFIIEKKE